MQRDMTIVKKEAIPDTHNLVIKYTATNYASERVEFSKMANDEEQFEVYDIITVTVEPRKP